MPPHHRCQLRLQPPHDYSAHAGRVKEVVERHLGDAVQGFELLYGVEPIAELTIEADPGADPRVWRGLVDGLREIADDIVEDVEDVRTLFDSDELEELRSGGGQGA